MANLSSEQIVLSSLFETFCNEEYPGDDPDEVFETFGATQVLKPHELSAPELAAGIVDGDKDGGLDSFFVFMNGTLLSPDDPILIDGDPATRSVGANPRLEVFLIQSKNKTSWEESVWEKLLSSLPNLLRLDADALHLEQLYRPDVVARTGIFRQAAWSLRAKFPKITFRAVYVARGLEGNITTTITSRAEQVAAAIRVSLTHGSVVTAEHIGVEGLYDLISTTHNEPAELKFKSLIRQENSFLGVASLQNYLSFIRNSAGELRDELFDSNVRDYEGDNAVNEAIASTLQADDASDFWWLNNGITVIADEANSPQETMTVSGPLVVNGLQTSHVLHRAEEAGLIVSGRLENGIVVRVIVSTDEEVRDRIIAGTNRQTQVPSPALFATKPDQIAIEKYLLVFDWYYERRKNRYKNMGKPARSRITMNLLAQTMITVMLGQPNEARARPSTLLTAAGGYERVFPETIDKAVYLAAIEILHSVDEFLATTAAKTILDENTNARFYVAAGYVVLKLKLKDTSNFHFEHNVAKLKTPLTRTLLTKALKVLAAEADDFHASHPKSTRDAVFKNSEFRIQYFDALKTPTV